MRSYAYIGLLFFAGLFGASGEVIHTVEKGDTLYSISKQYGVSVEDVQLSNGITNPSSLSLGMKLVIPHLYKVKKGDTLYSIAREQSSSVDIIRALNQLEGEAIFEGMMLIIPNEQRSAPLASSDPVATLSQRFDWPVPGTHTPLQGKFPGVAISAQAEEVVAVRSGRVIYVGPHSSFRHVVLIQSSNGYVYVYAGQERSHVRTGEYVNAGSVIGQLDGQSGQSTLYFSVWKNNLFVNPSQAPRG